MIFEEKIPRFWFALLVPVLALFIAYPMIHISERDLIRDESEYAVISQEMNTFPPVVTVHGQVAPDKYPLYPLLVRGLTDLGWEMEFSLRFISMLSLLGLVIVIWVACYRTGGLQAAAVASVMMFTTFLTAEKSVEGYPQMLTVFLIFTGWLLWFHVGQGRGQWDYAWILAGLFAGLAFYSAGWVALFYFIIPLAFQRRPLTIWPKINRWGFVVGAIITIGFILFWGLPLWMFGMAAQQNLFSGILFIDFAGVLTNILWFPFDVLLRFMPWTLMLWAPFCSALIPLSKNPLFSKFLRILSFVLFILVWLNPNTRGRDMLYLAPLFSTLVGLNYWIIVRRYGLRFLTLFHILAWILIFIALGCVIYLWLPDETIEHIPYVTRDIPFRGETSYLIRAITELSLAIIFAFAGIILCYRRKAVWLVALLLFCSMMMIFWAVNNPYKATDHSRREIGFAFREILLNGQVSPDTVIYKDSGLTGFYAEAFYMGYPVRSVPDMSNFPEMETIYIIAPGSPATTKWNWTKLFETSYKARRLYLWKGELQKEDDLYYYDDDYDDEE